MYVGSNSALTMQRQYGQKSNYAPNRGTSLFSRIGETDSCKPENRAGNSRLSAYDAYCSMRAGFRGMDVTASLGAQVHADLNTVENEKYVISLYSKDRIKNHWSIYDKESGTSYRFDPKNTTLQLDPETGKRYLVQEYKIGGLANVREMDASMESALKEFMGVEKIKSSCIHDRFDVTVNQYTGISAIRKKGAEGNGACILVDGEEQARKLEELAELYMEKYPSLMTSKEMAVQYAELEIAGYAFRDDNGILTIGIGGMGYMNAKDPDRGWGIMYSGSDSSIYSKIVEAFSKGAITIGQLGVSEKWEAWLEKKGVESEIPANKWDIEEFTEELTENLIRERKERELPCNTTLS